MKLSQIGAQLYTLRNFLKTPEDTAITLHKVKETGYDVVQVSGMGPIEPQVLKEILDREKLRVCVTHFGFEQIRDDFLQMVAKHKLWKCNYVGVGAMPGNYRNEKGYAGFAKEASQLAHKLADQGLKFVYHNHKFEFQKYGSKTGMDILLEESDPEVFLFEPDTYWIQAGGADPVAWIRKIGKRAPIIHFKDMEVVDDQQVMAEVGEGNLNWPAIIEACREAGVEWYLVEQDECRRDPMESLAISLRNLKRMCAD
ncbi:MAG: sugar phosphate isomerase/epimerase family protein [Bacillota bacterium]